MKPRSSPGGCCSFTIAAAFGLAILSGAAALAHQLLWTRRLVDVLGASAGTFSKVIGAFFAGLALGAWLASNSLNTRRNPWTVVALAELAVALLALPILYSFSLAERWFPGSAPDALWRLLLPILLVAPPATAMGLVIPWMIRALSRHDGFESRHVVWLYSLNALGGLLGIAGILFFALPRWGVMGAGWSTISLNLTAAAVALVFATSADGPRYGGTDRRGWEETAATPSRTTPALLAFASGFLVLGMEVALQHQLAQVTINSLFSSATILAMVIFALASSAALVPGLVRMSGDASRAGGLVVFATAALCAAQPFILTGLRNGVEILPYELAPVPYTLEVLRIGLLAVCPLLFAAGFLFPLLLREAAATEADGASQVGRLLAWNGAGGWLGAEVCQGLLVPAFGLWRSVVIIAVGYLALLPAARKLEVGARLPKGLMARCVSWPALTVGCGVTIAALVWAGSLPQVSLATGEHLVALKAGREGVVAAVEHGPDDRRMLFNNSYTLGGSKAQFNQERQAHVPLLLHGSPRIVATLGVATGGTVAGAALHPGVERIDAVELSPLVLRFAEEFFGNYNRDVFRDPRMKFCPEDARPVIGAKRAEYDVVIGDLFLPWRTGEGRLFAVEHFRNVRRSLKAEGMFCQWLPLFQLTRPQFEVIARTFREVFPEAFVVRGDFYADLPILGLVGGRELSKVDWPEVESGCAVLREAGRVTDPLARHPEGVSMMILGPLPASGPGPINTLANAWLEWDAGRNIVGLQMPWFVGVPCAEYVRDIHRLGKDILPGDWRNAHDAGQFFLTLEIAARLNLPVLADLESQKRSRLPAALREDAQAEWSQWPMRVKPAGAVGSQ